MINSLGIVSAQRLYRLIAEQIAAKIRAGEFAPGARLPAERELADRLQVSRSSIREALIALEIGGFVQIRVGSGVFVAAARADGSYAEEKEVPESNVTANNTNQLGAFELLEARMLIEPESAALAAQHATDPQIANMRELLRALSSSNTPRHHDQAFHAAIAQACGNAALANLVGHVWDLCEGSEVFGRLDEHMVTSEVWQFALAEHERVLSAIEDHDPTRARHEMHGHLIGILTRLRKDFAGSDTVVDARRTSRQRPVR
ncbi:MAG: FadR/GntR family transcriptional regulator [Burkholderiaceae bacterium]